MLDAEHGKIQFVKNAQTIGYSMPTEFVFQLIVYAKLTKMAFVNLALLDMI